MQKCQEHVSHEGGLISKRKYTSVRNSSDIVKQSDNRNLKTEIMQGCEIPKNYSLQNINDSHYKH